MDNKGCSSFDAKLHITLKYIYWIRLSDSCSKLDLVILFIGFFDLFLQLFWVTILRSFGELQTKAIRSWLLLGLGFVFYCDADYVLGELLLDLCLLSVYHSLHDYRVEIFAIIVVRTQYEFFIGVSKISSEAQRLLTADLDVVRLPSYHRLIFSQFIDTSTWWYALQLKSIGHIIWSSKEDYIDRNALNRYCGRSFLLLT